jgi:hypothetical protein
MAPPGDVLPIIGALQPFWLADTNSRQYPCGLIGLCTKRHESGGTKCAHKPQRLPPSG